MPHRLAVLNNELFVADSETTEFKFLILMETRHLELMAIFGHLRHPKDVHAYDNEIFVADDIKESILVLI